MGAAALGLAYAGESHPVSLSTALLSLIALTCVLFYMMALNDYFDREIDSMKGERSVLLTEEVSLGRARLITVLLGGSGLALAWGVSTSFLALLAAFFVLATLYSAPPVRYKRAYPFSTAGEIVATFLLFPMGYGTVSPPTGEVFALSSMPTFVAACYRFRHEARHKEFDLLTGKRTFAVVHGSSAAAVVSRMSLAVGAVEVPILLALGYFSPATAIVAAFFVILPVSIRTVEWLKRTRLASYLWGFAIYLAVAFV